MLGLGVRSLLFAFSRAGSSVCDLCACVELVCFFEETKPINYYQLRGD